MTAEEQARCCERSQVRAPDVATLDRCGSRSQYRPFLGRTLRPARRQDLLLAFQELAGELDPLQFEILRRRI
jgi:hypothetical protein